MNIQDSIYTYVHRSTTERRNETSRVGKVKRPLNAFMLYRKAYQNLVKNWYKAQHTVSRICGNSWALEPKNIRHQFKAWAEIERENHRTAHPHYKFTPSKSYYTYNGKPSSSRKHRKAQDWHSSKRLGCTDSSQTEVGHHDGSVRVNPSTFQANNPGRPMPEPYDARNTYQRIQEINGNVENIIYKKMHQHNRNGSSIPPMQHQSLPYPQHHDTRHLRQEQQHSVGERENLSLLPWGVAGQPPEIAEHDLYPHQLDPAHAQSRHECLQQVFLDQIRHYAVRGELGDPVMPLWSGPWFPVVIPAPVSCPNSPSA